MLDWYFNNARRLDPIVGVATFGLILRSPYSPYLEAIVAAVFDDKRAALYGALAGIAGSLLGFAIASVSIVLTIVQMPRLKIVRESKSYNALWETFHSAIWWLGGGTIAGLSGLALDSDRHPQLIVTAIASGVGVVAALRVFNSIWILQKIVEIATSGRGSPPESA